MSSKLLGQVWDYQFNKAEQSVMLAMADHAKEDGTDCYPSVERIAWKTDYSERQVQRVLHDLTRRGILVIVRKSGRNRPTEYRIDLSKASLKPEFKPKKDDLVSRYRLKDDTMSPQRRTKGGDTLSGYSQKDDMVSPHRDAKGRHFEANGVTFEGLKDDIAMSPEPLTFNQKPIDQLGSDDSVIWAECLAALLPTLAGVAKSYLTGSCLEAAGTKEGKPYYRVIVGDRAVAGVDWLNKQVLHSVRRSLSVAFRKTVEVEIVAPPATSANEQIAAYETENIDDEGTAP